MQATAPDRAKEEHRRSCDWLPDLVHCGATATVAIGYGKIKASRLLFQIVPA